MLYLYNQFKSHSRYSHSSPVLVPWAIVLGDNVYFPSSGNQRVKGKVADSAGSLCQSFVVWNVDVLREKKKKKRCSSCQDFLHRNKTSIHILLNFQDLIRCGTKYYSFFTQQEHRWTLMKVGNRIFRLFFFSRIKDLFDGKLWFKYYLKTDVFSLNFLVYHVTVEWDFVFYQTWNPIWCSNNVRLGDSERWVSCQISPSY